MLGLYLANEKHLAILKKGVDAWNKWRKEDTIIRADLTHANLKGENLAKINFHNIDLRGANLDNANLFLADFNKADVRDASLVEANLNGANILYSDFSGSDFTRANLLLGNFWHTDFRNTNFSEAYLRKTSFFCGSLENANLCETVMVETRILGTTKLHGCRVYGVSAWGIIGLKEKNQSNLIITPKSEPDITVDNLEVAQFIYLMLHSEKIRDVINTIGQKGVLIIGRFGERKPVLDAIRKKLRSMDYVPFVFDFEKPTDRDFTETVKTLAGMSRFIIADITQPKSAPLELQTIVPDYAVPMVTIIEKGERPFSMFQDLWIKYRDWVLEPLAYSSIEQLQRVFQKSIVDPANQRLKILQKKKAENMFIRDANDYEDK
jgi:uncharacterized protein YjbI with pentapeptide repeats